MLLKKRDHGCWGRVLGFLLRPILVSARALGGSGKQYCRKVCVCVCVCEREREREDFFKDKGSARKRGAWRFLRGSLQRLGYSKERAAWTLLRLSFDR